MTSVCWTHVCLLYTSTQGWMILQEKQLQRKKGAQNRERLGSNLYFSQLSSPTNPLV